MPITRGQRLFFTALNAVCMTYLMSLFNSALTSGELTWPCFGRAGVAFLRGVGVSFLLQALFLQRIAGKWASRYPTANVIEAYAIRTGFTVWLVCPILSLYNNAFVTGFTSRLPLLWLSRLVVNMPFAFFLQMFFVGPFTRWILRSVCPQTRAQAACEAPVE